MIVKCPKCGRKGKLDDGYAGRRVSCPECAVAFVAEAVEGSEKQTKWYYAVGEEKSGPIDQQTFNSLVNDGTIGPETLVWCKGMDNWHPLAESGMPLVAEEAELQVCSECESSFPPDKMMDHEGNRVCERCKLALLHKKQELEDDAEDVASQTSGLKNGGLGSRFMAKVIDLIFMFAIGGMVEGLSRKIFPESYTSGQFNEVLVVTLLINMLFGIFYITWFVGKFGATPGKMATKLKIVNANSSRVNYVQAFGRYCGEFIIVLLPFMIGALLIVLNKPVIGGIAVVLTITLGYMIAIFDKQRRTLYDRLCRTWVIRAS